MVAESEIGIIEHFKVYYYVLNYSFSNVTSCAPVLNDTVIETKE